MSEWHTCNKCGLEGKAGKGYMLPNSWDIIEGYTLCPSCIREVKQGIDDIIDGGVK